MLKLFRIMTQLGKIFTKLQVDKDKTSPLSGSRFGLYLPQFLFDLNDTHIKLNLLV